MVSKIQFLEAGHCHQIEKFVDPVNGKWKKTRFPSSVAVIEHAREGVILFDTGYSPRFIEATKYFPEKLYALATPVTVTPETTAFYQLQKMGIKENDIKHVILSHFHADHIAGAGDFKHAKYIYHMLEYGSHFTHSRFWQLHHAFIAALLPDDFKARSLPINDFTTPIPELGLGWFGKDLFGDESLLLVPLLGHSAGHVGLFVRVFGSDPYFLIGDASWLLAPLKTKTYPSAIAEVIVFDRKEAHHTFDRLHEVLVRPGNKVKIIPCHCHPTLKEAGMHEV